MTRYEERYRLTGRAAAGLAASVLLVVVGLPVAPAGDLPPARRSPSRRSPPRAPGVIDRVRRTTAFRADQAGITLGTVPDKLTARRGSRLFIPWADVERIILYPVHPRGRGSRAAVQCIGIQRRATAEPLRWGNEQAPGCPVPRVPAWATRMVTGWRLDRDRLAAVIVGRGAGRVRSSTPAPARSRDDGAGRRAGRAREQRPGEPTGLPGRAREAGVAPRADRPDHRASVRMARRVARGQLRQRASS